MALHNLGDQSPIAPERCAVVSADWGLTPRKRAVYIATRSGSWLVERVQPPPGGWDLAELMLLAGSIKAQHDGVLVGIDAAIGAPQGLATALNSTTYRDLLEGLWRSGGFAEESDSALTWSPQRPFFRVPAGTGAKMAFFEAAGEDALLRRIERRTRGNSAFILSGIPGSVGSGSRALWSELAPLWCGDSPGLSVWPFDGPINELIARQHPIVMETYPRASYAVALSDDLPAPLLAIAKTKRDARDNAVDRLGSAPWIRRAGVRIRDTEAARANEDDFDALITAVALVRLIDERRPLATEIDGQIEGTMAGTGGIDLTAAPNSLRRSGGQSSGVQVSPSSGRHCPIPGCTKTFQYGKAGWDSHVGTVRLHPDWHPELANAEARKSAFRAEFQSWLTA